jgi:hypothetical protein
VGLTNLIGGVGSGKWQNSKQCAAEVRKANLFLEKELKMTEELKMFEEKEAVVVETIDSVFAEYLREQEAEEQAEADAHGITIELLREFKSLVPTLEDLAFEEQYIGGSIAAEMDVIRAELAEIYYD